MDALMQSSIALTLQKAKTSVPWSFDVPHAQPYHVFTDNTWKPQDPKPSSPGIEISKLALYSWNIDFMLPFPSSRMHLALAHLRSLIIQQEDTATVIFLQECLASDLEFIAQDPWVRETFAMTDLDTTYWQSGHYGTVTLIDRRLPISSCFRVHYSATRMERDGLFVDVSINGKMVRLCNTHLESLALEPPYRIPQMKICAEYLRKPDMDAALIAGDLNAIQPFDRTLHVENGLKDAFLELGGVEEDVAGHTWGQQATTSQRERFGTSRMDKVFFRGEVELLSFETFGGGVVVEDPEEREELVKLGFEAPWITDHLGVKAVVAIPGKS